MASVKVHVEADSVMVMKDVEELLDEVDGVLIDVWAGSGLDLELL